MNDLLELAITAHGGMDRWNQFQRVRATGSVVGAIWRLKGQPEVFADIVMEGELRTQWFAISPFPQLQEKAVWEPDRQSVVLADGTVTASRPHPEQAFVGSTRSTPWDDLQAAYFASEANWNYFVAPFILAREDFVVEELKPWPEEGQIWRPLLVTYPESIVAHCRQQTYYFDDAGLLRRLDYSVDILGGGPAVHYPSEYREFDGILVPTRRRVYVRDPQGAPIRDSVSVAIDLTDISFS